MPDETVPVWCNLFDKGRLHSHHCSHALKPETRLLGKQDEGKVENNSQGWSRDGGHRRVHGGRGVDIYLRWLLATRSVGRGDFSKISHSYSITIKNQKIAFEF